MTDEPEEIEEVAEVLDISPEIEDMIPSMNVSLAENQQESESLISGDDLLGIYGEILGHLRDDRKETSDLILDLVEMVINGGDSTTATKEALVNLLKIKSDIPDKMTKIADLMTRLKMKDKDTFPRYLAANQNNTINIGNNDKRSLIKAINKAQKKLKDGGK